MPQKEYVWTPEAAPQIAAHSLAKHRILGEYVQTYLKVLTAFPGMENFKITLVDGFAGGGLYHDPITNKPHPGSPQILIDAVRSAEVSINSNRNKPLRIDAKFIFVEKNLKTLKFLKTVLDGRPDLSANNFPTLIGGAFEDHLEKIIQDIKSRGTAHRAIFVLDQYGYSHVPLTLLARIFDQLPKAEIFLTLAVGWITPYLKNCLGAAQKLGIPQPVIDRLLKSPDGELDLNDTERKPDLLAIQKILHYTFTNSVKHRFYTPFYIVSREANRPLWFLHIANNPRANDVVKSLHWKHENHFEHFGHSGLMMLGYDPSSDPEVTGQGAFKFDSFAKDRAELSLMEELPRRFSEKHSSGVEFGKFFQTICNETPANKELVGKIISKLCSERELEKIGANGEQRAATTFPHDDDRLVIPAQTIFSFSE